jgi:hypothetical protein
MNATETLKRQMESSCNGCDCVDAPLNADGYCGECAGEPEGDTFTSEYAGPYTLLATLDASGLWWWEVCDTAGRGPSYGGFVSTKGEALAAARECAVRLVA